MDVEINQEYLIEAGMSEEQAQALQALGVGTLTMANEGYQSAIASSVAGITAELRSAFGELSKYTSRDNIKDYVRTIPVEAKVEITVTWGPIKAVVKADL